MWIAGVWNPYLEFPDLLQVLQEKVRQNVGEAPRTPSRRSPCKCLYRSMSGTGTGIPGVFLLVWVPVMDLYEHPCFMVSFFIIILLLQVMKCGLQGSGIHFRSSQIFSRFSRKRGDKMSFGATVNGLVFQPVNFLSSWEGHVPCHPKLLRS